MLGVVERTMLSSRASVCLLVLFMWPGLCWPLCDQSDEGVVLNHCPPDEIHLGLGGNIALEVVPFEYMLPMGSGTFTTRVYRQVGVRSSSHSIMAPVLRWPKGSNTSLTLHNGLDEITFGGERVYNTNVHTHGLHISGYVDDVTVSIGAGQSHTYEYQLPRNHAGGVR